MAAKKLLVADDSLTIQKVIRLALSGASSGSDGYDIQAVSDGNDAIQQISLFRPDIVLIDVSLPGKTAFEVKRAINEHRDLDGVRFVLMSSAFEKVDEGQASEVHFHGRLTKPFDPAHLREVLSDVIAERTVFLNRGATEPDFKPSETIAAPPPLPPADFPEDLPPPLPPSHGVGSDNDIKDLTESTIRMSGLDDFQWSVQEPSLKPSPAMMDTGKSNFSFSSAPVAEASELEFIPPPPPIPSSPPAAIPISDFAPDMPDEPSYESHRDNTSTTIVAPSAAAASPTVSADQMETIIRTEVEKALRKFAQEMLPGVAEKVIKQEIHRMLMEQP